MPVLRKGPQLLLNFRVTTWVSSIDPSSGQRQDTDTIDSGTTHPMHVIEVENASTVQRDCRVVGKLPNGKTHLTFDDGGTATDTWSRDISSMAANDVREGDCPLQHVQEALAREPVRCEEVYSRRGNGTWVPETGKIPLGVQINVQK
jgi:hypothetical protein